MTGPMYQDEQKQELAERVHRLHRLNRKLDDAMREKNRLATRMTWTPSDWNFELNHARADAAREYSQRIKLEQELAQTKAALEDALHDAKRWRKIAEDNS